ncbi:MAG TPA: hypothetical protein VMW72_13075 [Sedimentisphaerales bacterium]|nr:hypothetical protein [Sedimentisphaerales bacterium]
MAEKTRFFEGKKYMWDGEEHDNEEQASSVEKQYTEKGFEVQMWREGGKVLIYTRRVVTEVVVE